MRSSREQRQQPTSNKKDLRQRAAVKPQGYAGVPSSPTAQNETSSRAGHNHLLEQMLAKENMYLAYKRVKQNGGAPGIDNVTVEQLQAHIWQHWDTIKGQLQKEPTSLCPSDEWKSPNPEAE